MFKLETQSTLFLILHILVKSQAILEYCDIFAKDSV